MIRYRNWLVVALTAGVIAQGAAAADTLPTVPLSINDHQITAEVAATPEQRSTGLMHRFSLRPDHGMIFVFERPEPPVVLDEEHVHPAVDRLHRP